MSAPRRVRTPRYQQGLLFTLIVAVSVIVLVLLTPMAHRVEEPVRPTGVEGGGKTPSPRGVLRLVANLLLVPVGVVSIVAAVVLYWLAVRTRVFTWSYRKPVFRRFRAKWAIVRFLVYAGLGFGLMILAGPFVEAFPASTIVSRSLVYLAIAFAVYFMIRVFRIWAPTEGPLIRRRLQAAGLPEREVDTGRCVIIRTPDRILDWPEDIGMLWFRDERLVYRGDRRRFDIQANDFFSVERENAIGDFNALWGAVPVIVQFWDGTGTKRLRLDPCGVGSIWSLAREYDELDEGIREWGEAAARGSEEEDDEESPPENRRV